MAANPRCEGLRDLVVDSVVRNIVVGNYYGYGYGGYGYGYRGPYPRGGRPGAKTSAAEGRAPAPAAADPGGAMPPPEPGPSHYTTTNVQERGVDEADLVKTDGRYVYTLHGNELVIAKTWPVDQTDVAARMTFKTLSPQALYLRGNDVVIQGGATEVLPGWQGRTRVIVVDATNRAQPRIRRIIDVEGGVNTSRLVGDDLYLVQSTAVQIPPRLTELAQKTAAGIPRADQQTLRPWEVQARLATMLRRTLLAAVTPADLDAMLPKIRNGGGTRQMACSDLYIPPNTMQLGVTSLAKVSLGSDQADLVGALVTGGTVYASTTALYVAAPHYTFNGMGYAEYGTQVHAFSLGDKQTRPAYVASGRVDGQILNQFAMSEYAGDLRIATTDWSWNGQQGGNSVLVLRPYGRELRQIGALRGLGKGERIYAGRMLGDKGYLVTFRQTDPLFTLDLHDPFNPRLAGELKINGFSSYIHPIGNDLLLTIGQDATTEGRVTGLHLQVFDVKDPARPVRRFHEKVTTPASYSYSAAQGDHHAFMYDPITGTLAFPMYEQTGTASFNGLAVYHLDTRRGFRALGRLDHRALADLQFDDNCAKLKKQNPQAAQYCTDQARGQARMSYPVSRSMVVDKYILSLSPIGLEIHELADLDVAATLSWLQVEKRAPIIAR